MADATKISSEVNEVLNLGVRLGLIAAGAALKLRQVLQLGPDVAANIQSLQDFTGKEQDELLAHVNAWRASQNLPPLSFSDTPPSS